MSMTESMLDVGFAVGEGIVSGLQPPVVEKAPGNEHGVCIDDCLMVKSYGESKWEPVRIVGFTMKGEPFYLWSVDKYIILDLERDDWRKVGRYELVRRWSRWRFKSKWEIVWLAT